jgi:hypothetical protein
MLMKILENDTGPGVLENISIPTTAESLIFDRQEKSTYIHTHN